MPAPEPPSWTVGELSEATGLSVRVLRHWEHVGLVTPTRTASGHRRYGSVEITQLYRAMALRRTGLSLRQIADLLKQEDPDPLGTLRTHLAEIAEDLRRRTQLHTKLAAAIAEMEAQAMAGQPPMQPEPLMKVIETMTMFDQYVHGYNTKEHIRLRDQAGTLVSLLHDGIAFPPGSSVLEAGCGVGAQTVVLAERSPDARITSIDISAESLAQARQRTDAAGYSNVHFANVDLYDLPAAAGSLAAGGMDHAFMCFILEHLPEPVDALRRLYQMVKPGGSVVVIEGDHGSTYFHPDSEAARDAIACQVTLQAHAGGNALTGRQLYPLLAEAGFEGIRVEPRTVYVDASRPELMDGFTRKTFTAMIRGIREPALAAGLITPERFDSGIQDLERTTQPDGVFCYTFFRAIAVRGG